MNSRYARKQGLRIIKVGLVALLLLVVLASMAFYVEALLVVYHNH